MRFTASILGWELDISLGPATTEAADDPAAALNGGLTASTVVDNGPTDRYMGFTGGWEGDGE